MPRCRPAVVLLRLGQGYPAPAARGGGPVRLARRGLGVLLAAAAALTAAPAGAGASPPPASHFVVTYSGAGAYRTTYHADPPNPGGRPDANDADDSSTQRWSLRFAHRLTLRPCAGCPAGLRGARGATAVGARILHTHRDGLFRADDMAQSCRLAAATPPGALLAASLDVRPVAGGLAIAVTAHDPVAGAALALPTQCPAQADSLDGLLDTYATPGFSFAPGFGPARWFTSRTVFIRLAVLRRTRRLAVAVGPAAASVPPRHCAVRHPSIERCATGGSWRGVLTFTALP